MAYTVFAVSLGIAIGTWLKRTLLALAITLGILLAVQVSIPLVARPHYQVPRLYTAAIVDASGPPSPSAGAWVSSGEEVNARGVSLDWANPPTQCIVANPNAPNVNSSSVNGGPATNLDCLHAIGYHWSVKYQPANRYWYFQGVETALYVSLAAASIAATYWLVLRRDA